MSKKFVWSDKFSVKVPTIDAQHKEFFEITNKITDLVDQTDEIDIKERLMLLLVELGEYSFYHLNYEEKLFNGYSCPGCDSHTVLHQVYRDKITEYLKASKKQGTDVSVLAGEAAEFARNWLMSHILNKDREYIECFEEHHVS